MSVTLSQFSAGLPIPAQYLQTSQLTVKILNEIFAALPGRFRFTSGIRTRAKNAAVGGVATSYHLTGGSGDFVPVDGRYTENDKKVIQSIVSKYGYEAFAHNVTTGKHWHIEPLPKKKRVK
jgi:hypothetical protein